MSKYMIICLFTGLVMACKQDKSSKSTEKNVEGTEYHIKGIIPSNINSRTVVMSYPEDHKGGPYKSDTTAVENGKFEFKGIIGRPQLAELNIIVSSNQNPDNSQTDSDASNLKNVALFYLDGNINITFNEAGMASYSGGGSEEHAWRDYGVISKEKSEAALSNGTITMAFYENLIADFVKDYPDRYVSVDLMDMFTANGPINLNLVEPMYDNLSPRMKNTPKVLAWKPKLDEAKKFESGNIVAENFTMEDKDGNQVSLDSYQGKYVLLDFWASWCLPCRAENPNVLAAYNKYKDENFTVLAVSLDANKASWLKAIKEDNLPWKQLSDLKGSDNKAAKLYGVSIIPDNFLINPEGKIIGRGLRGESLHKKLEEVIK